MAPERVGGAARGWRRSAHDDTICTRIRRFRVQIKVWVLPDTLTPHVWVGPGRHAHAHEHCACVSHYYRGSPPLGAADIDVALLHLSRAARERIRSTLPRSARWLLDVARGDADSGLESLLRLRLHVLGFRLRTQVTINGVGRVDFLVDRLIIEVDGRDNHDGESLRHKDLVRDAAAAALGYRTLRFDYAQVVHDWPSVQAAILAVLRP